MKKIKKYLIYIISVALGTALGIFSVEMLYKTYIFYTSNSEKIKLKNEKWSIGPINTSYKLQTDEFNTQVVTNAHGMREPHLILPKEKGTFRIVVVGNSFTYGWGVNYSETYGQVLERALKKKTNQPIEVINLSRPGADITDYIKFIRDYAFQFNPDLIIVGFLFGRDSVLGTPSGWGNNPSTAYLNVKNHMKQSLSVALPKKVDFWDASIFDLLKNKTFWIKLLSSPKGYCTKEWDHPNPLFSYEHIVQTYGHESDQLKRFNKLASQGLIEKAQKCEVMPYRINAAIATPIYWPTILGVEPASLQVIQKLWLASHEGLKEISELCKEKKVPVFFAGIPPAYSVDSAAISFLYKFGELDQHIYKFYKKKLLLDTLVSDEFLRFCTQHHLNCVSYLASFRAIKSYSKDDLYFPIDTHMTAKGNEFLGNLIAKDVYLFLINKK